MESSYLVKKVVFRVSFLPIVKLLAALMIHLIFLAVMLTVFAFSVRPPALYALQLIYYLCAAMFLLLGLSWLASSLAVFVRDTAQVIGMLLTGWFYLTPIVYPLNLLPEYLRRWIELNPLTTLVQLYREALLGGTLSPVPGTGRLVVIAVLMLALGLFAFRRLKGAFSDLI